MESNSEITKNTEYESIIFSTHSLTHSDWCPCFLIRLGKNGKNSKLYKTKIYPFKSLIC